MTSPYFVEKPTWTGWNPYSRENPVTGNPDSQKTFLFDFKDFSLWVWSLEYNPLLMVAYHPTQTEVGYLGYYRGGYCVSVYVDPMFRNQGLGSTMLTKAPEQIRVFEREIGSFNKTPNKTDPLIDREVLQSWYKKLGVYRK